MKIYSETSLDRFEAWSGGRDTLDVLIEKGLCDQLEAIINSIEPEEGWSDTAINDLLWFERDNIAEWLDFSDWDELENGKDESEEIKPDFDNLNKHIENEECFSAFCSSMSTDDCESGKCPFHCCPNQKICEKAYNKMLDGENYINAITKTMKEG